MINCKGYFGDIITVMVILFLLAVLSPVAIYILREIRPALEEFNTTVANSTYNAIEDVMPPALNYGSLILLASLFIMLIVTAIYLPTHPVFVIVFIFLGAVLTMVSAQLSNAYEQFARASEFASIIESELPFMVKIMMNLPKIITVAMFILIIALYAKKSL